MKKKKNIIMLLEAQFPPDLRVMNEAEVLQQNNYNVFIFCLDYESRAPKEILPNGIAIIRKRVYKSIYNKLRISVRWAPFINWFWKKFVTVQKINPDVIHVHDLPLAKVGWKLGKNYNAKFILDLHENYPAALDIWSYSTSFLGRLLLSRKQWKKFEIKAVEKADKVIIVIEEALERFLSYGLPKDKFCVVSNTVNLELLGKIKYLSTKGEQFKNRFNLVYSGGFGPHRGIEVLLQAMPFIQQNIPNVLLWIVGDGSDRPLLEKIVKNLNISDLVVFTGFLPIDEMSQIIYNCDLAILPHIKTEHTETTIPHKLFQYMFWKKPIVASDCSPIKRIVEKTKTGLIYSSMDFNDLVDKVNKIRLDKTAFGENGKKAVEQQYNWKKESENLLKLYSEI